MVNYDKDEIKKLIVKIGLWAIVFIVIIPILISGIFYTIPAGYRGVLLTFGKPDMNAKPEGLGIKIPIVQKIIKMEVKTQKYEAELTAASRDLQDVKTKIVINYRIVPDQAPVIYQGIGSDYAERILFPLEQETNKAATAQFTAEELITKREQVRQIMKDNLVEKVRPRGVIVEEISIINFEFSPSFSAAIESKVVAEQSALTARNKLEQTKYEAEQRVAQAKGEAEAIKIQIESIRVQGGEEYIRLKTIEKWSGALPIIMSQNSMPFIDMNSLVAPTPTIIYRNSTANSTQQ